MLSSHIKLPTETWRRVVAYTYFQCSIQFSHILLLGNPQIQGVMCFEHIFEPRPNELESCIMRLHTAISWVDFVSWWMLQTYKGNKMHLSENDAVLISVCEPLNYIHQDTKSARLIAVCRRSITLNKFGKRARGCCVHVFLVYIYVGTRSFL